MGSNHLSSGARVFPSSHLTMHNIFHVPFRFIDERNMEISVSFAFYGLTEHANFRVPFYILWMKGTWKSPCSFQFCG